jgi:hypothetical protein
MISANVIRLLALLWAIGFWLVVLYYLMRWLNA